MAVESRVCLEREIGNETSSETSEVSENIVVSSKVTRKAPVWAYFYLKETIESEASEDQSDVCEYSAKQSNRAICSLCKSVVIAKGGNTSNLLAHLRVHHPSKLAEVRTAMKRVKHGSQEKLINGSKKKQLTLQDALKPKYNRQSKKWQQLTDSVTFCLAKDMMPIYSIEKEGFRKLLYNFDPQYELPSRKYFSKTAIPILYSETQDKVAAEIKDVEFFSATADMWTSNTTEPYLSYTIHFVGNDWSLDTRCLQVLYLPKDHNGQNIAEALEGALDSWNLVRCFKTSVHHNR